MRKSIISNEIKKQHRQAGKSLRAFMKNGKQEKLHRFRTSVKRLRALAGLVQQASPVPRLRKTLQPLRKTFQLSGEIRDSYLHLEMGKSVNADASYLEDQQNNMTKAMDKLHGQKHLRKLQQSKKSLLKKVQSVKNLSLNLFYDQELRQLDKELTKPKDAEHLHACRKRLKVLMYDLPVVRQSLALQVNETYLEEVQTAIGDWHDNLLASQIFPKLKKQTAKLRSAVRQVTKDFYNKVTTPVNLAITQID